MSKLVPDGWDVISLKDVCFFQEGPGLRRWQYTTEGYPFINIRCIREGFLDLNNVQYISWNEAQEKYRHFFLNEGDYVLSSSGTLGRMARVGKSDLPIMLNTSVIRFRSTDENRLRSSFLPHLLLSKSFTDQITEESQGSAQVNFGPTHLKLVKCLLPPKPEQQKIASILTSVDEVIDKTEAQISKLQDLKKGMMEELLTKGIGHTEFKDSPVGRIPKSWTTASLGEISNVGSSKRILQSEYVDSGVPFFRSKEVILRAKNKPVHNPYRISRERFDELRKKFGSPQENEILITAVGTIGVVYLVESMEFYFKDGNLLWLRNISDRINPSFLRWTMRSDGFQNKIFATTGGSSQSALTIEKLAQLEVAIPPKKEQQNISSIFHSLDANLSNQNRKLGQVMNMKKGLMRDLLTGKVRVKMS